MNRIVFIGATFFMSGILLLGIIHLAIANYVPHMGGWSSPPGKFTLVREAIMIDFPYILSIILVITGLILLFLREIKQFFKRVFN